MNVKAIIASAMKLSGSHLDFLKHAFSDKGTPSMSRLMTVPATLVACFGLLWIIMHEHKIPDSMQSGGLAAFATAHYAVNRATTAWGKKDAQPEPATPDEDKANG
jgi:hypothetical protein